MAEIYNGRYALADPSSGLTALSMEGGEINMFGSCTKIKTIQRDSFPIIDDAPVVVAVKNNVMEQLRTGLAIAAVLAGVAIAVAVTGGAALAPLACTLGGAAIGTGAVAIGTAISDSQTGYNRSWGEYWERLITGCLTGYIAGASVYGLIDAIPAAATAAGVQASMMFGTSAFTAIVVPDMMVVGGYGLAVASGIYAANDIYSNSSGYDVILDKIFNNNADAYEAVGMALDMFAEAYTNLGESNQVLGNKGNYSSKESGEESSKKLENTGDNEDTGTGTTKGNNTKTTVDDNNTKAGTTKDDSAKSAIDNKDTEMTSGDTLSIEIKDKNSKQDVSETEVQGEQPIQNYSHSKENIEENKGENNKHSVNLDKSGENKTDKNTGEDRGKQEKSSDKGTSGEGIIIEQGNDGVSVFESGLDSSLLDELANSGVKYNPDDVVAITKTADGKIVWLENGTETAGLNHIIVRHANDFLNKGITQDQIPNYIMDALKNGKIIGLISSFKYKQIRNKKLQIYFFILTKSCFCVILYIERWYFLYV